MWMATEAGYARAYRIDTHTQTARNAEDPHGSASAERAATVICGIFRARSWETAFNNMPIMHIDEIADA